jgi:predicted xylose isomerase-like sugar epimerase
MPLAWFLRFSELRSKRQALEHIDHLLAGCPFVREVLFLTFHHCSWRDQTLAPDDTMSN